MGDMGDAFKELRDYKKAMRKERFESADPEGWSKHTDHHWYRIVGSVKINYWPSSGLCMIGKKKYSINSSEIQKLITNGG